MKYHTIKPILIIITIIISLFIEISCCSCNIYLINFSKDISLNLLHIFLSTSISHNNQSFSPHITMNNTEELTKEEFSIKRQFLNYSEKLIFLIDSSNEIFSQWDSSRIRIESILQSNSSLSLLLFLFLSFLILLFLFIIFF